MSQPPKRRPEPRPPDALPLPIEIVFTGDPNDSENIVRHLRVMNALARALANNGMTTHRAPERYHA